MKTVYLSVTNDILNDQRVNRVAKSLSSLGLKVVIVGVKRKYSKKFTSETYGTKLLWTPFQKGIMFYASFNLMLFFYLLFKKTDILIANDLDTLLPNFLIAKIKRKTIFYDSHELFTELPELVHRPFVKKIWINIEKRIVPKLSHCYTVCQSIAKLYTKQYQVPFYVVRNTPLRKKILADTISPLFYGKKIIIYQGALNVGRGIEDALRSMHYMENTVLLIAGKGDIELELKEICEQEKLTEKIHFLGSLPPSELFKYTCIADLGFSLEQHLGMSYYYALPNKLFDYIQSEIPVLVSNLPEMAAIVSNYQIGEIAVSHDPQQLAAQFSEMLNNHEKRSFWKTNLKRAAQELCWENEEKVLLSIYQKAGVI